MKKRRMMNMKTLWMAGFLIAAISTMFTMAGCSKDTTESFTNPVSATFKPKGTIQGVVVDAVTREPIVGARVSVGVGEATTNEMGQYVIKDVPATTDALNGSVYDVYDVSVDLRNATKPINMKTATEKYPEFSYRTVSVSYTSLNDTECQDTDLGDDEGGGAGTCGNSTNHDTKVDGLVANLQIEIGRLACNIKGTVYGCFGPDYATPQSAELRLDSNDDSDNTGSGHYDNIISYADAGSDGTFEFNNIECGGRNFEIVAADSLDNPTEHDVLNTTGPDGNNETLVLHLDQCEYGYGGDCYYGLGDDPSKDQALHLCPNDDMGPKIVEVTPEDGSDLAQASSQTAVFRFHEPVLQTAYATGLTASGVDDLYDHVEVSYDGSKAGNVSYSLAWLPAACTTNCTQLQVTFATGTSSMYHVTLNGLDHLTDAAGNPATSFNCPSGSNNDYCTVAFSTTGGNIPATVTDLVLKNDASLDEGGTQVGQYDWSIVSGAKTYVMNCQKVQVWGTATQDGPFVQDDTSLPASKEVIGDYYYSGGGDDDGVCEVGEYCYGDGMEATGSSAKVDFNKLADKLSDGEWRYDYTLGAYVFATLNDGAAFVENSEIELRYNCQVAGVNADGVAGSFSAIAANPADDNIGPILQENGNDLSCGTGVDPGTSGAICADTTNIDQIVLEFNEELNETVAETATNYVISGLATGTAPTVSTAVYSAADDSVTLTLSAVLSPLNLLVTRITTGANGIANTTAAGDDVQVIAAASGAAGGAFGPCLIDNGTDTVEQGDDVDTGREINAGANGVCETSADNGITPAETADTVLQATGANGRPSGTCVVDTTPYIAAAAGDTLVGGTDGVGVGEDYIHVGANGICQTTADASGTQVIPVGQGIPNATAITGGVNGKIDTETLSGDDTRVGGKVTVSNVTDVGGNTIRTTGDEYFSDGSVR
ncbi:MAG: hypothetical protein HZA18_01435 [Nitrospirae bacterium]|nr:hypothetical protein [Nitrospirota bacterium]